MRAKSAPYMITMHDCPRQTDGQTDEHGNGATIRSNELIAR